MHLREPGRQLLLIGLLPVVLVGCPWPGPGRYPTGEPIALEPPALTSFDLSCDLEAEHWVLQADADAWTGGGQLSWSPDLHYVEQHHVRSQQAAADGTSDHLGITLPIVGDWREAQADVSTAIRCGQDPSWIFVVFDTQGTITDCRSGGPDPEELSHLPDVPSCP